jgi:hypothetical protein
MRSKAGNGGYAKRVPVATRGTDAMRRRWEGMRGKRVAWMCTSMDILHYWRWYGQQLVGQQHPALYCWFCAPERPDGAVPPQHFKMKDTQNMHSHISSTISSTPTTTTMLEYQFNNAFVKYLG